MHQFLKFLFGIKFYMFRTVPLSIIRSFSLYTQQWYMSYRFVDRFRAGSWRNQFHPDPARKLSAHVPLLCVQWKTPDDGQRNCPKHAEFYSKYKFEKLVHLVGFILRKLSESWEIPYASQDLRVRHIDLRGIAHKSTKSRKYNAYVHHKPLPEWITLWSRVLLEKLTLPQLAQ